jgi:hypothetical protein
MDKDDSNPLRDAGLEALKGAVQPKEKKLDGWKQMFDRLE